MTRSVPISSLSEQVQRRIRKASKATDPLVLRAAKREAAAERREAERREFKRRCVAAGLPLPVTEYEFDVSEAKRKFRMDFAFVPEKLAVESNGGIWVAGAHGRGSGITRDYEKWSLAATQGWRIIHVVPKELNSDATIALCRAALTQEGENA